MAATTADQIRPASTALILAIGLAGGIMSGLFGVGGGVIFVPAMVSAFGLAQHRAQGTSLAIIVPTAIVGALTYAHTKPIDLSLAVPTAIGAVLFAFVSASLVHKVPAYHLKILFFVFVVISAVKLFVG